MRVKDKDGKIHSIRKVVEVKSRPRVPVPLEFKDLTTRDCERRERVQKEEESKAHDTKFRKIKEERDRKLQERSELPIVERRLKELYKTQRRPKNIREYFLTKINDIINEILENSREGKKAELERFRFKDLDAVIEEYYKDHNKTKLAKSLIPFRDNLEYLIANK